MGDTWQKYSVTLDIPEGMLAELEPADFVLAVRDQTRLLVDQPP